MTTDTSQPGSTGTVQLENERFRVTEWVIQPGGHIPMHEHHHDYVVVPMVTANMHVCNADGSEFVADLVAGQSYARDRGAEHRIENRSSDTTVVFVEVERIA